MSRFDNHRKLSAMLCIVESQVDNSFWDSGEVRRKRSCKSRIPVLRQSGGIANECIKSDMMHLTIPKEDDIWESKHAEPFRQFVRHQTVLKKRSGTSSQCSNPENKYPSKTKECKPWKHEKAYRKFVQLQEAKKMDSHSQSTNRKATEIAELGTKLLELERALASEKENNKKLEMNLKASEIDKVEASNVLQLGKIHIQKLRERLENEKAKSKEYMRLKNEMDKYKRDLHEIEVNLFCLKDENERMRKGEKDLKAKIEKLSIENECLRADSKLSYAEIRKLQDEVAGKDNEIKALKFNLQKESETNIRQRAEKKLKVMSADNKENQRNKSKICVLKETASSLGEAIRQSRKKIQKLCQTSREILSSVSNEENTWKMTFDGCESLEKECWPLEEKARMKPGDSQTSGKLDKKEDVELPNDQEFISKYLVCSFSTEENAVIDQSLDLTTEEEKNCRLLQVESVAVANCRFENDIALESDEDFCSTYLCTSSKPMDDEDYVGIENLL